MPSDMETHTLEELHNLPDLKMDPQRKREVLANIMEAERKWGIRTQQIRRASLVTKGVVACSLIAGTVWAGTQFMTASPGSTNMPDGTNGPANGGFQTPNGASPPPADTSPSPAGSLMAENDQQALLLKKTWQLASEGKVAESPFAAEKTVIDQVEAAWGKPDKHEFIDGIMYDTYAKRGLVFGSNKGMQIIDIRSYAADLQKIPLSKVNQTLGKPDLISFFPGQVIYIYNVNPTFQLKLVFPLPANEKPNPAIDHIAVYYPRGAVNLMAENQTPAEKKAAEQTALLQKTLEQARAGRVINSEFGVDKMVFDAVEQTWGQPDKQEFVADPGLTYSTYSNRGVVFGFNKGMQIADVRSYDPRLLELRQSQVRKALGKPDEIRKHGDQEIYIYNVNDKYQLKIIFPRRSKENLDPRIDHISVFYPRGAVNQMAQ